VGSSDKKADVKNITSTLIQALIKKYVEVQLEVIYDCSGDQ
jgi:hypothetical protein